MNNQVEEVKSKTDIVSLLSEYIDLKKAGRNYKANCPFHGEKTPSFMVSPELQIYKCFGCSKSGDVFTFLQEHENMEFPEALKYLADRAGVKLIQQSNVATSEKEKVLKINQTALGFYKYVLNSHPKGKRALDYLLKDRGLKEETITKFEIGYSPDTPDALPKYLSERKMISLNDLDKAGLIARGRNRIFDRFGGRVIFPLFDHRGEVVGFAGRLLPWDKRESGKYINSPETPAYHKSKVLYGLNLTKGEIKSSKYAIIVEGELDMISSWQNGVKNVVAIKGSAVTEEQIRLLSRFTNRVVLCLDSDFAGDEAARRGAILASNLGMDVQVATIEGFKDPDEAARNDINTLRKAILNAVDIWDFLIDSIFTKFDLSGSGKSKISREITPILNLISDKIVQSHYVEQVARRLSVPTESVLDQLSKVREIKKTGDALSEPMLENKIKSRRELIEERLVGVALQYDRELLADPEIIELITTSFAKKILNEVKKISNYKGLELGELFKKLPKELSDGFSEVMLSDLEKSETKAVIKELKMLNFKNLLEELGNKIATAEKNDQQKELDRLQREFSGVAKKLSALEDA